MAKSIKDILMDESPKNIKKIEKALADKKADALTKTYFDSFKTEVCNGTGVDFPKVNTIVTNSFICNYGLTFGYTFTIIPLNTVKNVYRCNMINGKFDYDDLWLAVESTDDRKTYISRVQRTNAKSLDSYVDVVAAIKSKLAAFGGGVQ